MLSYLKKKIVGSFSDRELKKYYPFLQKINDLESDFKNLSQTECIAKAEDLKSRAKNGAELDDLLPETFALVRKASIETLGERHFDVQLLGGIALHRGEIAEMKTGEGKTLTATLPLVLNALSGKGAHVVTVNDYLAERDSKWMGEIFQYLGMTVGVIKHGLTDEERRDAYAADITYGTNNEYGFDYLRDNMKFDLKDYVQRDHHYAIVDEVDSILIDEARTPLIISGLAAGSTENYHIIDREMYGLTREWRVSDSPEPELVAKLHEIEINEVKNFLRNHEDLDVIIPGDYTLEEKSRNIQLAESGIEKMQTRLTGILKTPNLFDFENIEFLHHVNQALKAQYVFKRDIDYVVQEGKVLIVDEFTGRIMEGRRFSDGLHQALEAKERVRIEKENQTLASITFQNYFRKYEKLAGMTGTAETEADEFMKIYNLGVVVIPTNKPMIRQDHADVIYKTAAAKKRAILSQIQDVFSKKQPVLVGTASIESSEVLSRMLDKNKIPHKVLNAKFHDQEAEIIAKAGQPGSVTIATNMAGRGTDIKLGEAIVNKGGLFILGTERNESRRVDNQLRGRSGRQGDAGASRYFLSLEDDLLRIFGGEKIANLMNKLKIDEDESIEHILISRAIENSQKKVEAHNFDIRKHLLEYDDVMNRQREIIYRQRKGILGDEGEEIFLDMLDDVLEVLLRQYCNVKHIDEWDLEGLEKELFSRFKLNLTSEMDDHNSSREELFDWISQKLLAQYREKGEEFGEYKEMVLRQILLEITDSMWKDHLLSMDHLKEGIGMRGYAQKNPLSEYKKEGFELFAALMTRISEECVKAFFQVSIVQEPPQERDRHPQEMEMIHGELDRPEPQKVAKQMPARKKREPGRNEPCHCGSGKKYKNCCLKKDQDLGD
ncbi:MAG: preprotein translocase subunit SecA [Deltaproteobacteria bacterium]|jgi:preprotein translocase subunit SecA|nr:preprotein translocase subunit SecA [Deltaproteobacteria bacterium]MBT4268048.1 preprotein translocase subunit SecA [Deltaproteobacteria bacterium]MBT4641484.1 preprotein translocase subunit SecA [Deltaproteobacteria bacterium]MBT6500099.1 preprotein translocase subunit SecA [Deltaproteobacteria bacterium]MBT7152886.1 preprotein translocase subunit SecA [Deltaproteobacteria bacterium]